MSNLSTVLFFIAILLLTFLMASRLVTLYQVYENYLSFQLERYLIHLDRFSSATRVCRIYLLSLALLLVLVVVSSAAPVYILMVAVFVFVAPQVLFALLERTRVKDINNSLPESMAQIAAAVRAGSTFQGALQAQVDNTQGALSREFALVLRERRVGVRMEEALENMAERIDSEEIDLMVSAVSIAQEVGGNLAETLQGLSDTIRRKLEMEGKIESLTAQGRLQGHVVTSLPLLMLLALSLIEPDITLPIFQSLLGWVALLIIAVMLLAGGLMIRKIVSIDI